MTKLVFVYGTLKSNFSGKHYFKTNPIIGKTKADYVVFGKGFPKALKTEDYFNRKNPLTNPQIGKLRGEIYSAGETTLQQLDRYEGYPSFYSREEIEVETPDGIVKALMYHANEAADVDLSQQTYVEVDADGDLLWPEQLAG